MDFLSDDEAHQLGVKISIDEHHVTIELVCPVHGVDTITVPHSHAPRAAAALFAIAVSLEEDPVNRAAMIVAVTKEAQRMFTDMKKDDEAEGPRPENIEKFDRLVAHARKKMN